VKQDQDTTTNVVRFRRANAHHSSYRDQKNLMDAVYCAGSLPVAAQDRETKAVAARLHLYGLVSIDAVEADGSTRRLRPSETIFAGAERPWRIWKASAGARRPSGSAARVSVASLAL
jgi:hypothetical protein